MNSLEGYSPQDLLMYGLIAVAVFVALAVLLKAAFKKEDRHKQVVKCEICGWKGQVSRYAGRCPKCNATLGDRVLD